VDARYEKRNDMVRLGVTPLALAVLLVAALLPAACRAADDAPPAQSVADSDTQEMAPPVSESPAPPTSLDTPSDAVPPGRFVSEVIDSTYFVEPAEFLALDLPIRTSSGALAAHLLGDVTVVGGRHDIIVRLFRAADYQNWLKRRGGRQAGPLWSSPRQRIVRLDQELPPGTPLVLLIDNGYSLRTPKRVRMQIQLQYQGDPGAQISAQPARAPQEGDVTPRENADDEFPPPPPPPPAESR
jgi:hypothetical protein